MKSLIPFLASLGAIVVLGLASATAAWAGHPEAATALGGAITGICGFTRWPGDNAGGAA
jgi:hypothetical protein